MALRFRRVRTALQSLARGGRDQPRPAAHGQRAAIELVSIHIPKSAGTSFFKSLKLAYGKDGVTRVDIPIPHDAAAETLNRKPPAELPASTRVGHGHFRLRDLPAGYGSRPDTPVITWLRDPVDRVLSNSSTCR
jgi:hypothetical protein